MALADFVRNDTHGTITLSDGTGTPVTLAVAYDKGDVSISGLGGEDLNENVDFEARGHFISSAAGARKYPQITFSAFLVGEAASAPGSVQAFLMKQTPYTANVSTFGAGRRYAVNFTLTIDGASFGADDWSSTFHDCLVQEVGFGESRDGDSFSFTLSCKGEVTGSLALDEVA